MPYRPTILPNITSSPDPTILRARFHHDIIRQVNNNTIAISPPRAANLARDMDGKALAAQYAQEQLRRNVVDGSATEEPPFSEQVKMHEIRRATSTVRVTNPEDEDQYVDVSRIDRLLMIGSDGKTYQLIFSNSG